MTFSSNFFTYNQLLVNKFHFGGNIRYRKNNFGSYFCGIRQYAFILDIVKTSYNLRKSLNVFSDNIYFNKVSLFLHINSNMTGININGLLDRLFFFKYFCLVDCYNYKWLPGFLTNFRFRASLTYIVYFLGIRDNAMLEKGFNFKGLLRFPDYIFFFNKSHNALCECRKLSSIITGGVVDSEYDYLDYSSLMYKIPGNYNSFISLLFLRNLSEVFLKFGIIRKHLVFGHMFLKRRNVIYKKYWNLYSR